MRSKPAVVWLAPMMTMVSWTWPAAWLQRVRRDLSRVHVARVRAPRWPPGVRARPAARPSSARRSSRRARGRRRDRTGLPPPVRARRGPAVLRRRPLRDAARQQEHAAASRSPRRRQRRRPPPQRAKAGAVGPSSRFMSIPPRSAACSTHRRRCFTCISVTKKLSRPITTFRQPGQ